MEGSRGRGPADLEPDEPLTPADYSSGESWSRSDVLVIHHERTAVGDGQRSSGGSPDRSTVRPHPTALEDEDRIEQAPQSTPRPDSRAGTEPGSPARGRKRPREGMATDMPSAKCLVRRLGALIPTASRSMAPVSGPGSFGE